MCLVKVLQKRLVQRSSQTILPYIVQSGATEFLAHCLYVMEKTLSHKIKSNTVILVSLTKYRIDQSIKS